MSNGKKYRIGTIIKYLNIINHSVMKLKITCILFLFGLPMLSVAQPKSVNGAPPRKLTEAEEIMQKAKTGKPFDVRKNCLRGDNLYSYRGQELYVPSHPYYVNQRYEQFREPSVTGENPDYYNTQYYCNHNDGYYGTEAKYVVSRTFVVDRIAQCSDDADEFIFEMHDKETRERVSYEYSVTTDWHRNPNYNVAHTAFPFIVMSHYNYLKRKYIGKKMVVACQSFYELSDYSHHIYLRNTQSGLTDASFTDDYSIFIVKDIIWEESEGMLCFVIEDNNGHSYLTPIEATFNEPEYSLGIAKKFLVPDWETCVRKYGIKEMTHIMRGDIHLGMDSALVRLSAGEPRSIKFATKSDGLEWRYVTKDVMVVFDDKGKVKDIVEGVPSQEGEEAIAMLVVGAGALSFGAMLYRIVSFPFRLIGRLFAFLGL